MPPKKATPSPGSRPPAASMSLSSDSDTDSELSVEPLVLLPPDGGYGWVVVVACFLMNLITDGAIYTFGFYQKDVQDDFAKDSAAVALLASLCSGFYYVAAPLWSAMGNRWGFRAVSVVGSLVAAGSFAACFFIEEYAVFVVVYGIVLGAASGGVYVATMISVGFYFERWRGVATSLTSCGSGVGILVMPLCYKAMSAYEGYSWRWILALNAAVSGVVALLSLLLRPLKPVPVSAVRGERTVRFQDEEDPVGSRPGKRAARAKAGKALQGPSQALRQLHASQTSFSPSVLAPQFDAISMTSRAFPRTGPDAKDMQGGSRPMYRDDIFYGASASRLTSQMSTRVGLGTTGTLPAADSAGASLDDAAQEAGQGDRGRCRRCRLCPHAVTSTLAALLHHSILTNSVFIVFAVTQVLVMMGYFTPFLFSQGYAFTLGLGLCRSDQALRAGVAPDIAAWILPSLGVANAVGRALAGAACEVPGVSALVLSCVTMGMAGAVAAATTVSASPVFQLFASSAYGFFMAPFMAMRCLILVDFLGIERLTNSFGLLLMFQGFAVMIGPPMSGWIYEQTESYLYVYILSGSLLFIASLLPYLMYPLSSYELEKEMKRASRRNS